MMHHLPYLIVFLRKDCVSNHLKTFIIIILNIYFSLFFKVAIIYDKEFLLVLGALLIE